MKDKNGIAYAPLINIKLKNSKNSKSFSFDYVCLVDSGAAACVFHAGMGEIIGINVKKGRELPLRGILPDAGKQYLHKVVIIIVSLGVHYEEEVGFTYEYTKDLDRMFPWGILGQNGFFDKFKIKFDLRKNIFEIK